MVIIFGLNFYGDICGYERILIFFELFFDLVDCFFRNVGVSFFLIEMLEEFVFMELWDL